MPFGERQCHAGAQALADDQALDAAGVWLRKQFLHACGQSAVEGAAQIWFRRGAPAFSDSEWIKPVDFETTYVEKLVGGKQVRATVKIGDTYGSNTEVISGSRPATRSCSPTLKLPTGNGNDGGNNGGRFPVGGDGGGGPPEVNFNGPPGGNVEVKP